MNIQFVKKDENAVTPSRANPRDIGMDLVAIKIHKTLPNGVVFYDTGISVSPPEGYHIEIVPRSSISKTGWMLANSVGVIDPDYTGNLLIALAPTSVSGQNSEFPLPLPFCVCQMVLRKAEYAEMVEVTELNSTERGDNGFGSTGARV